MFIPNRSIYDNILVIQDVVHNFKGKNVYIIFKFNLEKAYDKVF